VQEHAHRTELRQRLRALDQRVDIAGRPRAVDEARLEVPLGRLDRLGCFAQVGDVVERIVQPEDVDPVLCGRGDEASADAKLSGSSCGTSYPAEYPRNPEGATGLDAADQA